MRIFKTMVFGITSVQLICLTKGSDLDTLRPPMEKLSKTNNHTITSYQIESDDYGDTHGVDPRYDAVAKKYRDYFITDEKVISEILKSEGAIQAKSNFGGGFQTWIFEDSDDQDLS